jgi:hypothetical protein
MKTDLNESKKLEKIIESSLIEADDNQLQRAKALVLSVLKNLKRDMKIPDMLYNDWVKQTNHANNAFNFSASESLVHVVNGMKNYINGEIRKREILSDQMDDVLGSLKSILK